MALQANSLILDLLSAVDGQAVPVRALVRAAEQFGISGNNLRVALARLVADGKVERNERGSYGLSVAAEPVQRRVTAWSHMEERVVAWRGGWVAAHVTALPRGARAQAKRRRRALGFCGLRELSPGLYVRPDNIRGGAEAARAELMQLGLDGNALVFALSELDDSADARARSLWSEDALDDRYAEMTARLSRSGSDLESMPLEHAVVESFLLGGRAIRQLAYDPLLPEPIVRPELRRALIEEMRRYDRAGRRIWRTFMQAQGAPAPASVMTFRNVEVPS